MSLGFSPKVGVLRMVLIPESIPEARLSQSYFSTLGHPRDDLVRRGGELFDLVGESGLNTLDQITKR